MTDDKVPSEAAEIERARAEQSRRILDHLEDWLRGSPGRSIHLFLNTDGSFVTRLDERHLARGESLRDSAGQIAQVIALSDGAL